MSAKLAKYFALEMWSHDKLWLILIISMICVVTSAEPKPTLKSRVVDKPLSDELHFESGEHNAEFDHDAFLGKEEAKAYDELSPVESKKRLALLFVKVDKDGDRRVSQEELSAWMKHVQEEYLVSDTEKQWTDVGPQNTDFMTWPEYVQHTYGSDHDEDDAASISRDERRWQLADEDNDAVLSKIEFSNFLHPEEVPHMKESVIQETLDEVDKDHDGFISLEEYLSDIADNDDESDNGDGTNWSKEDEDEFHNDLDKDRDGKLDTHEIYQWVVPDDYDHIEEETKHLFAEADANKDGFLSGQEVLDNYELFVGSQVTDYGNALKQEL